MPFLHLRRARRPLWLGFIFPCFFPVARRTDCGLLPVHSCCGRPRSIWMPSSLHRRSRAPVYCLTSLVPPASALARMSAREFRAARHLCTSRNAGEACGCRFAASAFSSGGRYQRRGYHCLPDSSSFSPHRRWACCLPLRRGSQALLPLPLCRRPRSPCARYPPRPLCLLRRARRPFSGRAYFLLHPPSARRRISQRVCSLLVGDVIHDTSACTLSTWVDAGYHILLPARALIPCESLCFVLRPCFNIWEPVLYAY
ncbi:hypothetical protein B0H16DRAFT_1577970 [Mycena metata]|uniref:Secreted protein n=1 Tax=Mycena metata TaxID=1033252 RepID=A0AAD7I3C8_9AGAR|nr:hypothetical protein B0H16DRAFT_1577970 [Mycena metata]